MRQTVTNMIGTLPPQVFALTITTVSIQSMPIGESENLFLIDCLIKDIEYDLIIQGANTILKH